ncbi:2-hydroxy-6-oxo-6-phenylhexa-2,4-dienoate hydrolase [Delftia tsuruhatensis]|uniref:alpha/beta fold hydrolase n=1 Tax=Delftia tsuruhatensis TaxID=180282 RepID=UPI001E812D5C|nr:alpha/beta hydrolase [Delftia tsuruhatensis]CAB5686839.1 2-hydroxy-6-oxo-6-phenylhexa-2,4-dienoate hydrolase [Delftia tsuruhatensis]CAC9690519.1 2-hydroxy-6-oxo-6-phenylhexa-2,4-dienoate hydrolase [Delftia tsuruhatensis]
MDDGIRRAEAFLRGLDVSALHHVRTGHGVDIHWREWGQGPPLVLLHGGHGSWMHWARNIDVLSRHFRLLVPDLPGFGDSQDFDLPAHDASRLQALLQSLEQGLHALLPGQAFHLAGFSFGGAVAALLAARMERVDRLVLLGTAGHGGRRRETAALLDWRVRDPVARTAALRQNLAAFMLSGDAAVDALALRVHALSCEATRFRSKAISRGSRLPAVLQDYHRPMLLVWGEADVTAEPMEAAESLAQGRAERCWTIVPRAGHWVQYECAQEVNLLMSRWLEAAGRTSRIPPCMEEFRRSTP